MKLPVSTRLLIGSGLLVFVSILLFIQLSPTIELTRFRNALIATIGMQADFNWRPSTPPAAFLTETMGTPLFLSDIGERVRSKGETSLSAMQLLTKHLHQYPKRVGGPIQATTSIAYREIIRSGRGYCADYTQVFNGLAHAAGLDVREWGMSFDRFSGDGHAFNEIFDAASNAWIFIDPFYGFYVRDRSSGRPLSVLEFRERLIAPDGFDTVTVEPIEGAFLFRSESRAFEYYQRGADQLFMWFGNNVFSYDVHPLVQLFGGWSRSLEQVAAILGGVHPRIYIVPTKTNTREIESLFRFRNTVLGLIAATVFLFIVVAYHLYRWSLEVLSKRGKAIEYVP